mmetsp:Transcript_18194/g.27055  ORF Transcript_18194/g.27055 Transcript_18194/m.27055 type:complete len:403 (+) Transcript_18194:96-1304(+)
MGKGSPPKKQNEKLPRVFTPTVITFFFIFTSISLFIAQMDDESELFSVEDQLPSMGWAWYARMWFADICEKIGAAAKPPSMRVLESVGGALDAQVTRLFVELQVADVFESSEHGKQWLSCEDIAASVNQLVDEPNFCRLIDYATKIGLLEKHYISSLYREQRQTRYSLSYYGAYLAQKHPKSLVNYARLVNANPEFNAFVASLENHILADASVESQPQLNKDAMAASIKVEQGLYLQSLLEKIVNSLPYGACNNLCELGDGDLVKNHKAIFDQVMPTSSAARAVSMTNKKEMASCECFLTQNLFARSSDAQIEQFLGTLAAQVTNNKRIYFVEPVAQSTVIGILDKVHGVIDLLTMLSSGGEKTQRVRALGEIKNLLSKNGFTYEADDSKTKTPYSIIRVSK